MAANPLINQGTLNRLRGGVIIPLFPALNVTAGFLGEDGVKLTLEGESTDFINSLAGVVNSPVPFMPASVAITLLKTQNLASLYKAQMEKNSVVGIITVTSDSVALETYTFQNCSIQSVRELSFNGKTADYVVSVKGYYVINNDLWNLV